MASGRSRVEDAQQRVLDDPLNAVIYAQAAEPHGDGPLRGEPIVVKDNLTDAGHPCTAGSALLRDHRPTFTATAITRLRDAGAVIIGRTNLDEFAMGSSTATSTFGPTRHPLDPTRSPGGSSGGSAAAVAAGITTLALASDTGGSARQPAALCGVVALRPTYGRIPRDGLVALASSMDCVSPMASTVRGAALLCRVLAGFHPNDPTSSKRPVDDYLEACDRGVAGLRVGMLALDDDGADDAVMGQLDRSVEALASNGAIIERHRGIAPHTALAAYQILCTIEAASNLARYDGLRYRAGASTDRPTCFGPEVTKRLLLACVLSDRPALVAAARAARRTITDELDQKLQRCDVLLSPTSPVVAFRLDQPDPLAMYQTDLHLTPASLAGLPALTVPFGRAHVLPVGIHLTARAWDEATIFATAAVLEKASS